MVIETITVTVVVMVAVTVTLRLQYGYGAVTVTQIIRNFQCSMNKLQKIKFFNSLNYELTKTAKDYRRNRNIR